jgi:hypothetical protein
MIAEKVSAGVFCAPAHAFFPGFHAGIHGTGGKKVLVLGTVLGTVGRLDQAADHGTLRA